MLLADDRHDLRRLARIVLEGAGMRVVDETSDGTAVTALAGALRPDVVVLDLALPGTDGPELVADLRARRPDVGIVVYSGSVEPGIAARVRALGADRFLSKDAPLDDLPAAVREVARLRDTRGA